MTKHEALASARGRADGIELSSVENVSQVAWNTNFETQLRLAGFAIVPVEPTEKMIEKGCYYEVMPVQYDDPRDEVLAAKMAGDIYRAMIAAYEKEIGDG